MNRKVFLLSLTVVVALVVIWLVRAVFGVSYTSFSVPNMSDRMTVSSGVNSGIAVGSQSSQSYRMPPSEPYYPPTLPDDSSLINPNREYIKSSTFTFIVSDPTKYVNDLTAYYLSVGGRVLSSQINTAGQYLSGHLVVKIPVDKFDAANFKAHEGVKKTISANTSSTDDTASVDSATNRLVTLQAAELALQKQIAAEKDPAKLRQLELELNYIQQDIASAVRNQDQIQAQADWATITITVANSEKYFSPYSDTSPDLATTWQNSLSSLLAALTVLAALVIRVLVYSVIWVPVVFICYLLYRHFTTPPKSGK